MTDKMTPFSYEGLPPKEYTCGGCSASGVRLYRDFPTIARATRLLCTECAEKAGDEPRTVDPKRPDQIGWMVAAVPTEDGSTFWGFSSVPWKGVYWWRSLPTVEGQTQAPDHIIAWLQRNASNMQIMLEMHETERGRQDAEIARLRAALKPFAAFATAYGPIASTLDYPENHVLMQVGIPFKAVVIRLQDFYAALKALGEES